MSIDMQNFVRQVDIETGVIHFRDVPEKRDIVSIADMVKLDVVEAEILTGTIDLEQAAVIVEDMGMPGDHHNPFGRSSRPLQGQNVL